MVWLDKIYTRTGDEGQTGIGDGSRVSKLDARIVAGGSIDETNCFLGLAASRTDEGALRTLLYELQQYLFDLGADITCPQPDNTDKADRIRISPDAISWLEEKIDAANEQLSPLTSFVLPGGNDAAALLHMARAVCRRAELDVLRLKLATQINSNVSIFLNRLSDLLFVLARCANNNGNDDVLWQPGQRPSARDS